MHGLICKCLPSLAPEQYERIMINQNYHILFLFRYVFNIECFHSRLSTNIDKAVGDGIYRNAGFLLKMPTMQDLHCFLDVSMWEDFGNQPTLSSCDVTFIFCMDINYPPVWSFTFICHMRQRLVSSNLIFSMTNVIYEVYSLYVNVRYVDISLRLHTLICIYIHLRIFADIIFPCKLILYNYSMCHI